MKIEFSAPSKTFMAGEYIALEGYPALILNTEPRFKLIVDQTKPYPISSIYPESPAGKLIHDHQSLLAHMSLEFRDPHQGKGGFGASSAQFLMVYALLQHLKKKPLEHEHCSELLTCYQSYAWNGVGLKPSGADLISQWFGKVTLFNHQEKQIQAHDWPFENITFCLLHTGQKLPTHNHLKQLKQIPTQALLPWMQKIQESFLQKDAFQFILGIQGYGDTLQKETLVAETTLPLLRLLQQHEAVLASKGCGALGADVILVLLPNLALPSFRRWLTRRGLSVIATANNLSHGLKIV
ncbi:MAG: hypothetical protein JSS53_06835 [Proteobacteria bacterium]|nr:hypothetical protein [Pseudomonadota bacterium]